MPNPIRVLILEDQEADAELMLHELRRTGFDPSWRRVDSEWDYLEGLREEPDVILADYTLPQFDALRALNLMKEHGLDIPFIVVTGTIGEETAVALMKAGAHDYIMKENMMRLAPAVERELHEVEIRRGRSRMTEALKANEERFRELFEHMSSAVAVYEARNNGEDFVFKHFNRAAERIENISRKQLRGKTVLEVFPGVKEFGLLEVFQRVYKTGKSEQHPISFYKDRRISGWRENYVYKLSSGEMVALYNDVTERKRAERRQELVTDILDVLNSPDGVVNLVRHILLFMKNYTGIEAVGIRLREGEDYPYIESSGLPDDFIEAERYLCVRDEHNEVIRDEKGNTYLECMCGNVIQGRTDQALPFFTEGGSFWTNSTTKLLTSASEGYRQATTRNRCNSEGYESLALIPLKSGKETVGLLQLNDKRPDRFTLDKVMFVEGIGSSIGIAIARKRADEKLKESEQNFRSLVETTSDWLWKIDRNGLYTYVSRKVKDVLGYEAEEILGKTFLDLMPPDEAARVATLFHQDITEFPKSFSGRENLKLSKDGRVMVIETSGTPLFDGQGNYSGYIGFDRDITSRKQTEEALQKSEGQYRSIFENASEGIYQSTPGGKLISANPAQAHMYGYDTPEEMIASISDMGKQLYVNPEERTQLRKLLEEHGMVKGFVFQSRKKNGEIMWVSVNASTVKDVSGKIVYYEGIVEDITSRKMAEEALIQTMDKLRKSLMGTIQTISTMVEVRDPYTAGHQRRVSSLARTVAQEMGLSNEAVNNIRIAGSIHDIGKTSIPAEILSKPTMLTDIEFSLIKVHPQTGYDILKDVGLPYPVAKIVFQHHERLDGSGYPMGLKDRQILLETRIMSVADVVEAIASHRPYRPALGIEKALEEIKENKGKLYDKGVVEATLEVFRKGFKWQEDATLITGTSWR